MTRPRTQPGSARPTSDSGPPTRRDSGGSVNSGESTQVVRASLIRHDSPVVTHAVSWCRCRSRKLTAICHKQPAWWSVFPVFRRQPHSDTLLTPYSLFLA